jgi:hypothetical protein
MSSVAAWWTRTRVIKELFLLQAAATLLVYTKQKLLYQIYVFFENLLPFVIAWFYCKWSSCRSDLIYLFFRHVGTDFMIFRNIILGKPQWHNVRANFHQNPSSDSHFHTCGETEGRTDMRADMVAIYVIIMSASSQERSPIGLKTAHALKTKNP